MTRLADAEPEMYADICHTNRAAILYQLDSFTAELAALRAAVASGDDSLRERFSSARDEHQAWLHERAAPASDMPPLEDLKGPNLLFPQSWQDAFRGKRRTTSGPERTEKARERGLMPLARGRTAPALDNGLLGVGSSLHLANHI